MQHRVLAFERLGKLRGVADVALDHAQLGMVRQPAAEEQLIVNGDVVAFGQQTRGEHMPDIAGPPCDQHVLHWRSAPLLVCGGCALDGTHANRHDKRAGMH